MFRILSKRCLSKIRASPFCGLKMKKNRIASSPKKVMVNIFVLLEQIKLRKNFSTPTPTPQTFNPILFATVTPLQRTGLGCPRDYFKITPQFIKKYGKSPTVILFTSPSPTYNQTQKSRKRISKHFITLKSHIDMDFSCKFAAYIQNTFS